MAHNFLVAAFCCTWGIQLSYLLWVALKWEGQKSKLSDGTGARRYRKP
jgi:hypothetical protein